MNIINTGVALTGFAMFRICFFGCFALLRGLFEFIKDIGWLVICMGRNYAVPELGDVRRLFL